MNTKELFEIAYIAANWDIRNSTEEISNLIEEAKYHADLFEINEKNKNRNLLGRENI